MEDELKQFLEKRGIKPETVERMNNEKIDAETIRKMSDESLREFIPILGDRIHIKSFCSMAFSPTRRREIVNLIRQKLSGEASGSDTPPVKRKRNQKAKGKAGNRKPKKSPKEQALKERVINLGWYYMHYKSNELKHMRAKQGGGTYSPKMDVNLTKQDILDKAISLFFNEDKMSSQGHLDDFVISLIDSSGEEVIDNLSIKDMYKFSEANRLHFYLLTVDLGSENEIETESESAESLRKKQRESFDTTLDSGLENESVKLDYTNDFDFSETEPMELNEKDSSLNDDAESKDCQPNNFESENSSFQNELPGTSHSERNMQQNTGTISPEEGSVFSDLINDDLITIVVEDGEELVKLQLHRGRVLIEMIHAFMQLDADCGKIIVKMKGPNGKLEVAEDGGGVFKDALSEFWGDFYSAFTLGTGEKVPAIRDDFKEAKWTAVAKIIRIGYIQTGYFPLQLSRCFVECCLFEREKSDLLIAFLSYVSDYERKFLLGILQDFDAYDFDTLLDILNEYNCRRSPNKDTLKSILMDIAHKEIIQRSKFIIDVWQTVIGFMISDDTLDDIYRKRTPENKNVKDLLVTRSIHLTKKEDEVFGYLKKFIREADKKTVAAFLRFCTGADMITTEKITIDFNQEDGFKRNFVAHTCGDSSLIISSSYSNFLEFRSELFNLLDSKVWVMDLI